MLYKIIKMLADEHTYSIAEIADNLNISSDLMDSMLRDLARMGYIKDTSPAKTCTDGCNGCSVSPTCGVNSTTWELTEKSKRRIISLI